MRISALLLGSLVLLGCGPTGPSPDFPRSVGSGWTGPSPDFPWSVGSGWTATPLDEALAGSASGCRVQVSRTEDGRPTAVSARYPGFTVTRRPDGTISARARVQRGDASLEASLELSSGGASIDEQALLASMARPYEAPLPLDAHLVRTYEVVRGNERFTLQERGAREPSHTERYEADEGREHLSRTSSASMTAEGQAVISGRTRRLETSRRVQPDVAARLYLHAESVRLVTEVLDEAGEIIAERVMDTASGRSSSWELRLERDGSGRTVVTDSRRDDPWTVVVRRSGDAVVVERTRHGCTSRVRHDREGRLLSREYVAADPDDPSGARCPDHRFEVTRDAEGRVVRADTFGAREADRETLTFLYDAQGRLVQLTEIRARERSEVRAVYAASGQLISELDEWSWTDEGPECEPPECEEFEHVVASSRHLERTFDEQGRLVRSSRTYRPTVVGAGGSTETEHRSLVDYAYEGCAAEIPAAERGHEALLESPIELL